MPPKLASTVSASETQKIPEFRLAWAMLCQMSLKGSLIGIDWEAVGEAMALPASENEDAIPVPTKKALTQRWDKLKKKMADLSLGLPLPSSKDGAETGAKKATPAKPRAKKGESSKSGSGSGDEGTKDTPVKKTPKKTVKKSEPDENGEVGEDEVEYEVEDTPAKKTPKKRTPAKKPEPKQDDEAGEENMEEAPVKKTPKKRGPAKKTEPKHEGDGSEEEAPKTPKKPRKKAVPRKSAKATKEEKAAEAEAAVAAANEGGAAGTVEAESDEESEPNDTPPKKRQRSNSTDALVEIEGYAPEGTPSPEQATKGESDSSMEVEIEDLGIVAENDGT